jgi:hypothetical protein
MRTRLLDWLRKTIHFRPKSPIWRNTELSKN